MDDKTIIIDMNAPAVSAEYHFGIRMYCISHGEWSEWISKAEFLKRIEEDEMKEARRDVLYALSTRIAVSP